nr:MAG TPA: hypothetical protein [Caudoviricetes sp.]
MRRCHELMPAAFKYYFVRFLYIVCEEIMLYITIYVI